MRAPKSGLSKKLPLLVGLSLLVARVGLADTLAYVRASSQYLAEKAPAAYHPLNLLDDDPATVWCEGIDGTGEGEEIRFYFKEAQKVDRVVVTPTPETGRRVSIVRLSDGTNNVNIELADSIEQQPLKRPLSGTTYTLTVVQVAEPQRESKLDKSVACLADVLLYFKNKPFGGKTSPDKLKYDARRDQILGRWSGEPLGAPERFMIFAIDGTWDWTFVPMLGGKSSRVTGEYRFRGDRLLMRKGETGRWADVNFKHKHVKVDPSDIGAPLGDYDVVAINSALGEDFAGEYNNAAF
ncbi:MAG: hypothetical protein HY903_22355 [Deltaproteobacteria bacterium]|nr:hypothetical protein [Deltaproteobacteria bacterium]